MPLKIVEQFDSSFVLDPDTKETLVAMLSSEGFCQQVCAQIGGHWDGDRVKFTGMLFQPVPYTPREPKGMPAAYEQYYNSPDYIIINVPPNFMFKAKIFKPSRLCAIYQKRSQEPSSG